MRPHIGAVGWDNNFTAVRMKARTSNHAARLGFAPGIAIAARAMGPMPDAARIWQLALHRKTEQRARPSGTGSIRSAASL